MKKEKEDKALRKAIQDLPEHIPSAGLWEDIASQLEEEAPEPGKGSINWMRYAAALLLIAAGTAWYLLDSRNSGISFGEELSDLENETSIAQVVDSDFEVFLEEECSDIREVCEMPEFKTLITQLTELEAEVTNIAYMIETTGFDEFLYKAKTKADQETVRIKKELVKLLRG